MIASAFIYVVAVPLVVAAIAAIVMRRVGAAPRDAWAVGVGLGYVAGHVGLKSQAGIGSAMGSLVRPMEARDWVPHAVLLAMAVNIVATHAPAARRRWIGWAAALLTLSVPIRLLSGNVAQRLSMLGKVSHLALLAATLGLVWLLLANASDDDAPMLRPMLVAIVAAGSAVVLEMAGSHMSGQACGVVATAIAGTGLVAMWPPVGRGIRTGFGGAAGVVAFSLGSLVLLGHFYAELSAANAALLLIALAAAGGPMPTFVRTGSDWFDGAIRALLCSIPLAVAVLGSVT